MSTVRDLIQGSLRLIGAVATGETPSAAEQADAFSVLTDMLDSWSTENLIIYAKTIEKFTLIPGTQSYTIGTLGTFNTPRPLKIESATIETQNTTPTAEFQVELINVDQWSQISIKGVSSDIPRRLYYDDNYPLSTINLWPMPSTANKLVLYSWKPITSFANVNATISLPPGYAKALRYNLALELAPEYGKDISTAIITAAMEGKENIKRMNQKPNYLSVDSGALSRSDTFNWLTGE